MQADSQPPAALVPIDLQRAVEEIINLARDGRPAGEVLGRQFDLGLAFPTSDGPGGRGLDRARAEWVASRLAEADVPRSQSGFVGRYLATPLLAAHGTEAQRALLRATFLDEVRWCQLFSEPSAGSDLANISTRAERDGERWRVTGQKVWNSYAAEATHGLLLARTRPDVPKHAGISLFVVDMTHPGVDVRPLREMTGEAQFNEVFLEDVEIDASWMVGADGDGWRLGLEILALERAAVGARASTENRWNPIDAVLGLASSPSFSRRRDDVVRCWVDMRVADVMKARDVDPVVLRVFSTEANFRCLNLAMDLLAGDGMLYPGGFEMASPADSADQSLQRHFLFSRGLMIGGGTLEINRNVIGERILGLPREPRVDKDVPWNQTRR